MHFDLSCELAPGAYRAFSDAAAKRLRFAANQPLSASHRRLHTAGSERSGKGDDVIAVAKTNMMCCRRMFLRLIKLCVDVLCFKL